MSNTPGDRANNAPYRPDVSMQRITRTLVYNVATDGTVFPEDSPKAYTYDGSNNVTAITATWKGKSFVRTFGYTGANVTSDSGWVAQ